MIINDNHMKMKALDAISGAKDCAYFRILPTGELQINNHFKSYIFLAYVRGNWFASYGMRKSASMEIPQKGLDLFVYGDNSIWIQNNENNVDVSTSVLPLDESTRVVLFAFTGKTYDIIIADGSKYATVISTYVKKTQENTLFLIMALTSMIRQYDDKAADDILQFWFSKNTSNNSEKEYSRQIMFTKQENVKKTDQNI